MAEMERQHEVYEYTVGLICALPEESAALCLMLDSEFGYFSHMITGDNNHYSGGKIGDHFVVLVALPASQIGTNSASTVASNMKRSFYNLRFVLLVGTGGGIPSADHDIRLGDVVVSQPQGDHGGVVYYDRGKETEDGFERCGHLNRPPDLLLGVLQSLKTRHEQERPRTWEFMERANAFMKQKGFAKPDEPDRLFKDSQEVERPALRSPDPQIHYGLIASGNKNIRRADLRDRLVNKGTDILCIEMEAAGIMNIFDCLVIRGISDYADCQKNNFRRYAALTAAAFAREFLLAVPASSVMALQPLLSIQGSFPFSYSPPSPYFASPLAQSPPSGAQSPLPSPVSVSRKPLPIRGVSSSSSAPDTYLFSSPELKPAARTESAPETPIRTSPIYARCETCTADIPSDDSANDGERIAMWCCVHREMFDLKCGKERHQNREKFDGCELFYVRGFREHPRSKQSLCRGQCWVRRKDAKEFIGISCEECGDCQLCVDCIEGGVYEGLGDIKCSKTGKKSEWTFYVGHGEKYLKKMVKQNKELPPLRLEKRKFSLSSMIHRRHS